jgi:hypothetical protein
MKRAASGRARLNDASKAGSDLAYRPGVAVDL